MRIDRATLLTAALAAALAGCPATVDDDCPPGSTWNDPLCVPERFAAECDEDRDDHRARGCGGEDCDDRSAAVHPGAPETCNGIDDDCDGETDEDGRDRWHPDGDDDGWGRDGPVVEACAPPDGHVARTGDCDDGDGEIHPEHAEICNEIDDDCDGFTDEGTRTRFYRDDDRDGYGDVSDFVDACSAPAGRSPVAFDCDDDDRDAYPGQIEFFDRAVLSGGWDFDCDGVETPERTERVVDCVDCTEDVTGWESVVPACGESATLVCCTFLEGRCSTLSRDVAVQRCR